MFFVSLDSFDSIATLIKSPAARYFEAGLGKAFLCTGEKEIYNLSYNNFLNWCENLFSNSLFENYFTSSDCSMVFATARLFGNIAVLNSRVMNNQVDSDKELRKAAAWQANILSSWLFPFVKKLRSSLTSKKDIEQFDADFFYAFKSWEDGLYYKSTIRYLIDISNIGNDFNYNERLALLEPYEDGGYWDSYIIDDAFKRVIGDCEVGIDLLAGKTASYHDDKSNPLSQFVAHMNRSGFWGEIYTGNFDSYFFEQVSEFTILLFTLTPKEIHDLYEQYRYSNHSFYSGSDCYPSNYQPKNASISSANNYTIDLGFRIFGLNCNEDFAGNKGGDKINED